VAEVRITPLRDEKHLNEVMDRLVDILMLAYQNFPEYGVKSREEGERYIKWLYGADPNGIFLAYVGNEIAGFIASCSQWWDRYLGTYVGEVHEVSVDSKYQGMGIGSRLMDTAEDYFLRAGRDIAGLWVGVNNEPAIRFYEKRGYVPGEVRGKWLRMRKVLRGEAGKRKVKR